MQDEIRKVDRGESDLEPWQIRKLKRDLWLINGVVNLNHGLFELLPIYFYCKKEVTIPNLRNYPKIIKSL